MACRDPRLIKRSFAASGLMTPGLPALAAASAPIPKLEPRLKSVGFAPYIKIQD